MFDFVYEGGSFGVSLSLDVDGLMSDVLYCSALQPGDKTSGFNTQKSTVYRRASSII